MLRIVFLLLLLGNAGYYMWSHGYLAGMGLAPELQSEPQRLQEQIRPDGLVLQQPEAVQAPDDEPAKTAEPEAPAVDDSAPPAAPESKSDGKPEAATVAARETKDAKDTKDAKTAIKEPEACYQANGIEEAQADSIRRALAGKSKSDWELVASHQGGRWMVYMGKFPDAEFMDRKRGELRLMNIDFDRAGGGFEPGLSLGRFSTEEAAQRQLATFTRQGVRTARVVLERQAAPGFVLKLPAVTDAQRQQWLATLRPAMAGKTLGSCS